ncbi:SAF domain-containing protein [Paenibacillus sp. EC2-1]|uniref:SAF domain-containing protein n=1 Tax=Paenibacillus sp. EC2-1 TaxID=3388665 RepID=UPI003BEEEBB0
MPIIRQRSKKLLYAGFVGAGCMSVILLGGFYFIQNDSANRHAEEKDKFQQRIQLLEASQLDDMKSMRIAWVPLKDIPAGQFINSGDLREIRLPLDASPENLPVNKEEVTGKGTKIELRKGTPITLGMLFSEEATPKDLRNREMKSIYLPSNLKQQDVVDIRIQFPTGQDYIVLSKKRIDKLSSPAFWTTLSEQEILLFSSAIVDAYIHKASLYALTYVEPGMQDKAVPNYPPNQEVIKLIKSDPNIVKKAEKQLESSVRTALDQDLSKIKQVDQMHAANESEYIFDQGSQTYDSWTSENTIADNKEFIPDHSSSVLPLDEVETEEKKDRMTEANDILGGQSNKEDKDRDEDRDMETIFTSP